jgi:hypothetical protein
LFEIQRAKELNNSRLQLAYNLQHNKSSSQLTTQQAIKATTRQPKVRTYPSLKATNNEQNIWQQASLQHKYTTNYQGNYLTIKCEHTNLSSHGVALAQTQSPNPISSAGHTTSPVSHPFSEKYK